MCHLFVLASLSIMTGLFVILTPLTKLFPTQDTPTLRTQCAIVDLVFVVTIAEQTVTGWSWLLTQQTAQLWHKHSTGHIDPDKISAMSSDWSDSIILASYWLQLTLHSQVTLCILLHPGAPAPGPGMVAGLWLVRGDREWPLIGRSWPEAHLWLVTTS